MNTKSCLCLIIVWVFLWTNSVASPLLSPFRAPETQCEYQTVSMLKKYVGEEVAGGYYVSAVRYYDTKRREDYRVRIRDGLLVDAYGAPIDWSRSEYTDEYGAALVALYVMDTCGRIYLTYHHEVGIVQHSSFLAGEPIASGGEALVVDGRLLILNNSSGHYRPNPTLALQVVHRLKALGADLSMVMIEMSTLIR
jgi:hypothetical protein